MWLRTRNALKKFKSRGLSWLIPRLQQEFRYPSTPLGRWLLPMNKTLFSLVHTTRLTTSKLTEHKTEALPSLENTLCLFYDLEICPITFDFCWVLSLAEFRRKQLGLEQLFVIFVPGPKLGLREEIEDYETVVDSAARHFRLRHILHPMLELVPACCGYLQAPNREIAAQWQQRTTQIYPEDYRVAFPTGFKSYQALARLKTQDAYIFQASAQSKRYVQQWLDTHAKGRKVVAITLRQYGYSAARNSNIDAWSSFIRTIDHHEYCVVIVPDTEIALLPIPKALETFLHFTPACFNLSLRAALYELAYLNLGINNGPFLLCWFNASCRYIMFKVTTPEIEVTTSHYLEQQGFIPNDPHPFPNPLQKWVWEADSEDILKKEFNDMVKKISNTSIVS